MTLRKITSTAVVHDVSTDRKPLIIADGGWVSTDHGPMYELRLRYPRDPSHDEYLRYDSEERALKDLDKWRDHLIRGLKNEGLGGE